MNFPGKKKGAPVFTYLAIMFAVAFLMLLLAYFIQQRNSEVTVDGLKDSLSSSSSSVEDLQKKLQSLEEAYAAQQEGNAAAKGTIRDLQQQLVAAEKAKTELEAELKEMTDTHDSLQAANNILASWNDFWEIEQLYQSKDYKACAEAIMAIAPSTHAHYTTPESALERANTIWDTLVDKGYLTEDDAPLTLFH